MANVKISELPAATSAGTGDEIPANQSGTTRKLTRAQIVSGLAASGANSDITSLTGLTTALSVAQGGTGATTESAARTSLGLGSIATQAASNVAITGGSVTGITDLAVADGGTGASTAPNARTNLGAAASGANSDITSLTGLTTALSVAQGGTGGTSQSTARTGLGLVIGADVQAYSANLASFAGKTAPSGAVVGTTDTQTLTGKTFTGYTETVFTITDGAAFEINPSNGTIQTITLGASRTPKGTSFAAGQSVTLMVNDGSAYTLTWTDATFGASGVIWVGGTAPTLATTGFTVIELWEVGTQVYGALVGNVA